MKFEVRVPNPVPKEYVFTFSKKEIELLHEISGANYTVAKVLDLDGVADFLDQIFTAIEEKGV